MGNTHVPRVYMPVDNNTRDDNFICLIQVISPVEEMIHKSDPTHVL